MPRFEAIEKLKNEEPVSAAVRMHKGMPRLYLNKKQTAPLFAWSWKLAESAVHFKNAGVHLLHPILGLNSAWPEDGAPYDWTLFDSFFDSLLEKNPDAFFLPRVHLDMPRWWLQKHKTELLECALPTTPDNDRQYRDMMVNEEGGFNWGIYREEPSLASPRWKEDMERLYCAFLNHIENSPLRSRIFGYQIGCGVYGEWHYYCAEFMPDCSTSIHNKLGEIPTREERLNTEFGLLRDPAKEKKAIHFYRQFHEDLIAETILDFAALTKKKTNRRALCGVFYGYQLENVWMQEGGHLAPEKILTCPDIDFFASPYSYQTTNIKGREWWEHDVEDGAGNWLGRARGEGGDGAYRVLLESLRRHGKLYLVEIDPTTYLEPPPVNPDGSGGTRIEKELCMVGGQGCTTREGTMRILQRDFGQVLLRGHGGWIFDFGPVMRTGKSWYADQPLIDEVAKFRKLLQQRAEKDLTPIAEVAAVYDAKSFFVTRHWRAEAPWKNGGANLDFFSHWFMTSQARTLHRMAAPIDFLYRFDLQPEDAERYKLLFMVNTFYLTSEEIDWMTAFLSGSGITVVWFYAPGFVTPDKLDLVQMERLTGFKFNLLEKPGTMLINCSTIKDAQSQPVSFGVNEKRNPRFAVTNQDAEVLGMWADGQGVAFARKKMDGWQSIYVGTAPLPVEVLRHLATAAGVRLWSSEPDNVMATKNLALVVASSAGPRTISLPHPMAPLEGGEQKNSHEITAAPGDVTIFTTP